MKAGQRPMKWTTAELIELQNLITKLKECIPLRNPASPVVKKLKYLPIMTLFIILTTGDAGLRRGLNYFLTVYPAAIPYTSLLLLKLWFCRKFLYF